MTVTPDRHDGESFPVPRYGFHAGYARSVAELERQVEHADLAEEALRRQRANLSAVAGSCHGWKNTEPHPGSRHRIIRWPLPRGCAFQAGSHWHGRHDTRTRPGPHGCPFAHCSGYAHQRGRRTSIRRLEHVVDEQVEALDNLAGSTR